MSSFLGRASQFYAMPLRRLVRELLGKERLFGKGIADLDMNPSPLLEHVLAESVEGWRSPLDDFQGVYGPIVVYKGRHVYCPRCFREDLAMGRVPYFRMDWSAFFVSTCWIHRSLLLPWYATNAHGFRYLPKEWLYGLNATRKGVPIFFEDHLRLLDDFEEGATRIYGGLDPREVTERFARLQSTLEKQSSAPIPVFPQGVDPQLRLRRIAYEVATVAVGPLWGVGPHSRNNVKIAIEPESYELLPVPREPEIWSHPTHAIRRVVDLNRRRTFLWVVAMSLGGTKEFGALLCPEGCQQSWRQWWTDCLIPMAGKFNRKRFEGEMARLSKRLDGMSRRRPRFR